MNNDALWNLLSEHFGHHITIAKYGNPDNPADICLECEDCNAVLIDAELYTVCERDDVVISEVTDF